MKFCPKLRMLPCLFGLLRPVCSLRRRLSWNGQLCTIVAYSAHSYFCGNHFKDKMASPRHVTKSVARVVKVLYVKCSSCCLTVPTSVDVSLSNGKRRRFALLFPFPEISRPFSLWGASKSWGQIDFMSSNAFWHKMTLHFPYWKTSQAKVKMISFCEVILKCRVIS